MAKEGDSIHQGFFADQQKRKRWKLEPRGTASPVFSMLLFYTFFPPPTFSFSSSSCMDEMKEVDEASGSFLMREEMKS